MSLRPLWDAIKGAMSSWHQGKLFVEHAVAIDHDALHIVFGVLLWLTIAAILRRSLSSRWPWLWLLAVIAWNETVDLWTEKWPDAGQQYGEGAKDLLLTMLLPTLLALAVRFAPRLFRSPPSGRRR